MSLLINASTGLTSSTVQDGVADPSNSQLYLVESTGPSFRKFDLNTHFQVGTNVTCLSSPGAVCIINSASSVIASTSVNTVDFIENATGYRTNATGGLTLSNIPNNKGQRIASDTASGIAFYTTSTANTLVKIVASTQAVTQIIIPGISNFLPAAIILKSTGRWLVGGRFGKVYEIDSTGSIVDQLDVVYNTSMSSLGTTSLGNLAIITISGMSYDNNMLFLQTEGGVFLYDYSTKTKLWDMPLHESTNQNSVVMCASASGETLMGWNNTTATENNVIAEVDFTTYPVQVAAASGIFYSDSQNKWVSTGFCAGTNLGFALQLTVEKIRFFTINPRQTALRLFTVQNNSVDQKARLILIDDTGGVGTAFVAFDTIMQSPATYRVPTGRSIIEVVIVGEGTTALFDVSRYTT